MSVFDLLQLAAIVVAGYMLAFWLLSIALRDASIVDIGWGLGFVLVAWVTWWAAQVNTTRAIVLLTLVTLWGLRLSVYLGYRNIGKPEDRRYQAMREKHGRNFWWISLFTVFAVQGIVMWIVSLPVVIGLESSRWFNYLTPLNWVGILLWVVGIIFEAVGDWQLARFKSKPENQGNVCDQGLWRYTRHPNYFGDFCVWWGHWLVSFGLTYGPYTIVSPLLMGLLLMRFSGVGLLESTIEDRRPDYADYKRRTSAFFPWPPNSGDSD